MEYIEQNLQKIYLIRLIKGEDIFNSIETFCKHVSTIESGLIQGIGAVSEIHIGYYNGMEYQRINLIENFEILSLTGNVVTNNIVHIHGIFGRSDGSTLGGHIFPGCIVSFTCEILIFELNPPVIRKMDKEIRLNLLDLPNKITSN
ncbi:PPC domain-containing DNA-binding protein [Candidatus Hodarchaeum mangrovi]